MAQKFIPFATVEMSIFVDEDALEDGLDPKEFLADIKVQMEAARENISLATDVDTTAHIQINSIAGNKFS